MLKTKNQVCTIEEDEAHSYLKYFIKQSLIHEKLEWRHHGIGVLQAYLPITDTKEYRIHIWSPKLIKVGKQGSIHDHRFDFTSHLIYGTLVHQEHYPCLYDEGPFSLSYVDHARAPGNVKYQGPFETINNRYFTDHQTFEVRVGEKYNFPSKAFHCSLLVEDLAVTFIEKYNYIDQKARILHPFNLPLIPAFGHTINTDLVNEVVEAAIKVL